MTAILTTSTPPATNRVPDPSLESDTSGFPTVGNTAAGSYDTATKYVGTRSYLATRLATALDNSLATVNLTPTALANAYRIQVNPGDVVSIETRIMCDQAAWRGRLRGVTRNATNANVDVINATTTGPYPAMAWQNLTLAMPPASAGVTHMYIVALSFLDAGLVSVGAERVWHDAVMVNTGANPEPYFDGATPGCTWDGAANASTSTRLGVYPLSAWDGKYTQPLTVAGVWDGAALQPANLTDITVM